MEDTDKIERNCEVEGKRWVDSNIYGDHGRTGLAVLGCYRGDMTKKIIELRVPLETRWKIAAISLRQYHQVSSLPKLRSCTRF